LVIETRVADRVFSLVRVHPTNQKDQHCAPDLKQQTFLLFGHSTKKVPQRRSGATSNPSTFSTGSKWQQLVPAQPFAVPEAALHRSWTTSCVATLSHNKQ